MNILGISFNSGNLPVSAGDGSPLVSRRQFGLRQQGRCAVPVHEHRLGNFLCRNRHRNYLVLYSVSAPEQQRTSAGDSRQHATGNHLVGHSILHCAGDVFLGNPGWPSIKRTLPKMRWKFSSPANNGCGKCSIPGGKREINDLHVPVGEPVKLTITSEDVIHSYYIPSVRLKRDAVPGIVHLHVVYAKENGEVPHFLRRVLRVQTTQ